MKSEKCGIHTYECFHNLDIEVINAETKALHHSAPLFYENQSKLLSVVQKFAITKDHSRLKMGNWLGPLLRKILTTTYQQKKIQMLNMVLLRISVNLSLFEKR